jgi:hypothetical protein
MPITERASTGLQSMSRCLQYRMGDAIQAHMVFDAWAGHENDHNGSKERANACRDEGLLPCLHEVRSFSGMESEFVLTRPIVIRDAPVFQPTRLNLFENQ